MVKLTLPPEANRPEDLPPPIPQLSKEHQARNWRRVIIYLSVLLAIGLLLGGVWYANLVGYISLNSWRNYFSTSAPTSSTEPPTTKSTIANPMVLQDASTDSQFKIGNSLQEIGAEVLYLDGGNVYFLKKDGTADQLTSLAKGGALAIGAPTYESPKFLDKGTWLVKKCSLDSLGSKTCGIYSYDMSGKLVDTVVEKKYGKDDPITLGIFQGSSDGSLVAYTITPPGNTMSGEVHIYDRSAKKDSTLLNQACAKPLGRGVGVDDLIRLAFSPDESKLLYNNTTNNACSSGELDGLDVFDLNTGEKLYGAKGMGQAFVTEANWLGNEIVVYVDPSDQKAVVKYNLATKESGNYLLASNAVHFLHTRAEVGILTFLYPADKQPPASSLFLTSDGKEKYETPYFEPNNFLSEDFIWGSLAGYCNAKACPGSPLQDLGTDGNTVYQFSTGIFYRIKGLGTHDISDARI